MKTDIRDVEPTIVLLNADFTFNGGTLAHDAVGRVWRETLDAFRASAHREGLGCSWTGALKCSRPEVVERRLARLDLTVEPPPTALAVPPEAPPR